MAKSLLLLTLAMMLGCSVNCTSNGSCTGFGYELLTAKIEYLENKLLEYQIAKREEMLQTNRQLSEQASILQKSKEQVKALQENQNLMKKQLSDVMEQFTAFMSHSMIMNAVFAWKLRNSPSDTSALWKANAEGKLIKSCKEVTTKKVSGRFWLGDYAFEVYCLHSLHGGGWTVIQNRFDGSVNFTRNWAEYKEGFGNLGGEFWLGLDKIYQLTASKPHELLIYLEDFDGVNKYVRYDAFGIGGENENYALKTLAGASGPAGDSFHEHKGKKFATPDRNDEKNCANFYQSGWWFGNCFSANLNGVFANEGKTYKAIIWSGFHHIRGLRVSRMMIREKV